MIVHGCYIYQVAFLPSWNALQDPFIVPLRALCISSPTTKQIKKQAKTGAPKETVIHTDRYCCKYLNYILHRITIVDIEFLIFLM